MVTITDARDDKASPLADVWPKIERGKTSHCAALFIDIRGSSAMSGKPGLDSTTIADRTEKFISITHRLLKQRDGQVGQLQVSQPASIKSLGDGLLCVWDMTDLPSKNRAKARKLLLGAVVYLDAQLGHCLKNAWDLDEAVETGMGVAEGDAAISQVGESKDYFGYTVNLASKLQSFARPHGIVIATKLVGKNSAKKFALHTREFVVPMVSLEPVQYYVTKEVYRDHKWTCLAWPGLAISHSDAPSRPPGLNTKGITVVTHEGVHGKIGTLQIWPRNERRDDQGDPFEIIIDDFDGLSIMKELQTLDLTPHSNDFQKNISTVVSDALLALVGSEQFLFVPVRCGLNALAWNKNTHPNLSRVTRYSEILDGIKSDGSLAVALYDNAGASLPVLLRCLPEDQFTSHDVFDASSHDLQAMLSMLRECQQQYQKVHPEAKMFLLYEKIQKLAYDLQYERVNAVLGGGAWLANPKWRPSETVVSGIPKDDQGFLWIEGAALLRDANPQVKNIIDFLLEEVLDINYQQSLISARPYGATPVHPRVLRHILSMRDDIVTSGGGARNHRRGGIKSKMNSLLQQHPDARPTLRETLTLFKSTTRRNDNVTVRRRPKCLKEWQETWNLIRAEFCRTAG